MNIYFKGISLGSSVFVLSLILDNTICRSSLEKLLENQKKLYFLGMRKNFINLVLIAPLFYCINYLNFVNKNSYNFEILNSSLMVFGHNIFYYYAHMAMHKVSYLRFMHIFHHQFEKNIVPSVGNAVSHSEFLFAYLLPFILSSYLLRPNLLSVDISIGFISLFNMFIHTDLLYKIQYSKYFVSPKNHIDHHKIQYKHYAAPILNIDYFLDNV